VALPWVGETEENGNGKPGLWNRHKPEPDERKEKVGA